MSYCRLGEWVVIPETGQIGRVDSILRRRTHECDGEVIVQCGAGGPFLRVALSMLREATGAEAAEAQGL